MKKLKKVEKSWKKLKKVEKSWKNVFRKSQNMMSPNNDLKKKLFKSNKSDQEQCLTKVLSKHLKQSTLKTYVKDPEQECSRSKIQFFTDIWYSFCRRLLRSADVIFLKTMNGYQKFIISGFQNYFQTTFYLHISICQSQFIKSSSMWDTL